MCEDISKTNKLPTCFLLFSSSDPFNGHLCDDLRFISFSEASDNSHTVMESEKTPGCKCPLWNNNVAPFSSTFIQVYVRKDFVKDCS